jgi:hypothetical protein
MHTHWQILTGVGRINRISNQHYSIRCTPRLRGTIYPASQGAAVLMCRMERLRKEVAAIEDEIDEIK